MVTLLIGPDWKQNNSTVFKMLAQDVNQEQGNRILLVPELISHQSERQLSEYAGDCASRFAEVLSFTRLAKRVAQDSETRLMDCLDNGGRIVAMAAATRMLHSKLKAYASVETKPEFLMGLLDAVDEFKRCCITPETLMEASRQTQGSLSQKLEELSLILEAYDAVCARGKRDPRDQITWLLELLEDCDFAEKHVFYIDSFPDFSRQNMDILYHLILNSPNVVISLTCDHPGSDAMAFEKAGATAANIISFANRNQVACQVQYVSCEDSILHSICTYLLQGSVPEGIGTGCLHLYKADSVYTECCNVVEKITELVEGGCRYRDISIVCPDMQTYENPVYSLLKRSHIPAYLSGTEDILEKTVIHTVLTAMDAALGGFEQRDVLRYLKSALSPINIEACDKIENYAILWSINGKSWLHSWENHPKGLNEEWSDWDKAALEELNKKREKAMQPLENLREGFRNAIGVRQQILALYQFLSEVELGKRLQYLAKTMDEQGDNRNAQIMNQLWDILIGALEQMYDVLGDITWDTETFTRLLKLLLSQYDVGTIPSVLDAVTVGSVSAMRCQKSKHLFVLGASEGVFPSYGSAAGVLNDQERSCLIALGVPLNAGAIDGLQTQFSEIHDVFCGALETVSVSYSGGQPSFIYNRLKKMINMETDAKGELGAALTDRWEAAAYLSSRGDHAAAEALELMEEYNAVCHSKDHTLGTIEEENIRALYGNTLHLSASQIDRLAECRLSYFLKYGLKAKERKAANIDPAEFGTYVHAVLEECGKTVVKMGGFKNVSLEQTLQIASEFSAKYFADKFAKISTQRMNYHFNKNSGEVQQIVKELWNEMQDSQFQAKEFELHFGKEGRMPAVSIPGSKLDAQLQGYVDRVDSWNQNGTEYVRVVDYKTGKKDFDYCDVYNGIGLQMLLYLYALEDGGEEIFGSNPVVAGVQYFPARVPLVAADGFLTPEEAENEHSKEFKRKGLILSDEPVLRAMEPSDEPKRLSIKRNKDGLVSGDVATSHQFVQLKKYLYKLLKKIVDDISSGNVTPNPYTRGTSHNACAFCPYGPVCHPEEVVDRRNFKKITADRFWSDIEKEVE